MKVIPVTILCLIFSITKCHCKENQSVTLVYAVENKVFAKKFGVNEDSALLTELDNDVTELAILDGCLYVSQLVTNPKDTKLWAAKISDSGSLQMEKLEGFEFSTEDDENILSIVAAADHVYSGSSNGKIRSCWTDKKSSCVDMFGPEDFNRSSSEANVTRIEYNNADHDLYAVLGNSELWHCSTSFDSYCSAVSVDLENWASFHVAFDFFWVAGDGILWKCPFDLAIDYENCLVFHNLTRPIFNMDSSSETLYLGLDSGFKEVWQCDPNTTSSCFKLFEAENIGPFKLF